MQQTPGLLPARSSRISDMLAAEVKIAAREYRAACAADEGYVHPISRMSAGPEIGKQLITPSARRLKATAGLKRALDRLTDFYVNGRV